MIGCLQIFQKKKNNSPVLRRIVHTYGPLTNASLLPRTRSRLHCCLLPRICRRDSICLFSTAASCRIRPAAPFHSALQRLLCVRVSVCKGWASFSFICVVLHPDRDTD